MKDPESVKIKLYINGIKAWGIVDTGASTTLIGRDFVEDKLKGIKTYESETKSFTTANGEKVKSNEEIIGALTIGEMTCIQKFIILEGLQHKILLGTDWMLRHQIKIDFTIMKLIWEDTKEKIYLFGNNNNKENEVYNVEIELEKLKEESDWSKKRIRIPKEKLIGQTLVKSLTLGQIEEDTLDQIINKQLSEEERKKIKDFIKENEDIFAKEIQNIGKSVNTKHRIIVENEVPIKQRAYRLSLKEKEVVDKEVEVMLNNGIIRKSSSDWSSPVVLVPKPDGSTRFCIDYRKLNKVTKKDNYPLPRIDESIDKLAFRKFYTSMDLYSGYWQIEMEEQDKEKTAFITDKGLYEFNKMPFGLCNAPATFQRMMNEIFKDIDWTTGGTYIDDIIVASDTFDDHLADIQKVFNRLREHNLKIKLKKCEFFQYKLVFLGHSISKERI